MIETSKHPSQMSFWSENHSAKVMATVDPGPWAHAAARRLIEKQPDSELLAAIVFGDAA